VVAGASLRGYGVDVVEEVDDVTVEILLGTVMLRRSAAPVLTLLVVLVTVDGDSVKLSPA